MNIDAVCANFYSHIKLYLEEMPTFSLKEISVNNATYIKLNARGLSVLGKGAILFPLLLVLLKGKGNEKVNTVGFFFFFSFGRFKNMIKI